MQLHQRSWLLSVLSQEQFYGFCELPQLSSKLMLPALGYFGNRSLQ